MERPIRVLTSTVCVRDPEARQDASGPPADRVARRFRASWDDRVKREFRGVLLIVGLATFYLVVGCYGIGTHRFWLTPIGLLGAVAAVASFFTWLSPNPPRRSWTAWVWVPLAFVPVAVWFAWR